MSRGLDQTFKGIINSEYIKPALFVKASFSSELRIWSGHGSAYINGTRYDGAGELLSVGTVQENSDLGTSGLTVSLSGCDNQIVNAMRDEEFQGNELIVYLGVLDDVAGVRSVAATTTFFKGFMDNATYVQNGETITIQISVENHLARLSRTNTRLYTAKDQKNVFPNDLGLDYIESIAEQKLIWGE